MPFLRVLEIVTNYKSQMTVASSSECEIRILQSLGLKNSFRLFGNIELLDDNLQRVVGELFGSLLEVDDGKFLSGIC